MYRFNETSNTSQLVSEEERFNSSEYTSNESIKIHVQDVMKLNQLYRFAARAVNAFGISEISALSDAILLNVSRRFKLSVVANQPCVTPLNALCNANVLRTIIMIPLLRANNKSCGHPTDTRWHRSLLGIPAHRWFRAPAGRDLSQRGQRWSHA